jgi:hypothetical protein
LFKINNSYFFFKRVINSKENIERTIGGVVEDTEIVEFNSPKSRLNKPFFQSSTIFSSQEQTQNNNFVVMKELIIHHLLLLIDPLT